MSAPREGSVFASDYYFPRHMNSMYFEVNGRRVFVAPYMKPLRIV